MQLKVRGVIPHNCLKIEKLCLPRAGKKTIPEHCMYPTLLGSCRDNPCAISVVFGIGQILCMYDVLIQL